MCTDPRDAISGCDSEAGGKNAFLSLDFFLFYFYGAFVILSCSLFDSRGCLGPNVLVLRATGQFLAPRAGVDALADSLVKQIMLSLQYFGVE